MMRWPRGVDLEIVVEVAHRTSILPLVLAGVGHAVMPSSWAPLAHKSGLRTLLIEPVSHLDVAILSRKTGPHPGGKGVPESGRAACGKAAKTRPHERFIGRSYLADWNLGLGRGRSTPVYLKRKEQCDPANRQTQTQRGDRHMSATQKFNIASIPADGVGKEVVAAGRRVLDALAAELRAASSPSTGPSSPGAASTTSRPAR